MGFRALGLSCISSNTMIRAGMFNATRSRSGVSLTTTISPSFEYMECGVVGILFELNSLEHYIVPCTKVFDSGSCNLPNGCCAKI